MCVIGVEMMMEAMVTFLVGLVATSIYYFIELTRFSSCDCAVVLFRSREHENCGPQPGYVRAHIESKSYCSLLFLSTRRLDKYLGSSTLFYLFNSDITETLLF